MPSFKKYLEQKTYSIYDIFEGIFDDQLNASINTVSSIYTHFIYDEILHHH